MWPFLIVFVLCFLLYYYFVRPHSYWKNRGVPQTNPKFLFGDNWANICGLESLPETVRNIYKKGEGSRYIGFYQMLFPTLMIRDVKLLKQMVIKDFDHFMDHRQFLTEDIDHMWARNLFSLKGQRWKDTRATITPIFSSGKIKSMFPLMVECAENFVNYFISRNQETVTLEMKDISGRYTLDVIANTAFGIKCDSLKYEDNEFYQMSKQFCIQTVWQNLKFFSYFHYSFITRILKFFKCPMFPRSVYRFYADIVRDTLKQRRCKGLVRHDLLDIMAETQKSEVEIEDENTVDTGFATVRSEKMKPDKRIILSDDDISALAMSFFFAGYETSSGLISFTCYELAMNPDIQQKLRTEINEVAAEYPENITYDAMMNMKYLDMVISESLRKWPIAPNIDREVTKPYVIEPIQQGEKPVHLKKGDVIWIPFYSIHRDEKYYPNPEKFDPERFNEKNRKNIDPLTYLPFGIGPRVCIGSRFAILEVKVLMFYLIKNFELVPVEKTTRSMKFSKKTFIPTAEGGFWFGLKRLS